MKTAFFFLALLGIHASAFACETLPSLNKVLPRLSGNMEVISTLNETWILKQSVRNLMKKDYQAGAYDRACSNQYKKFFIDLRTYEDRVADIGVRFGMKATPTAYEYPNPQLYVTPGQKMSNLKVDLQSGDIVLSRGNAYTSAAIAHLGESNEQFSHLSLVYKHPVTGKLYTVEAHIELGVIAKPIQNNILEMNSRDAVFRFQDTALAARAAEYMYNRAHVESARANINYDFAMDMKESKNLFCSEVASHAFDVASEGVIQLPLFKSTLTERNVSFEHMIAIHQVDSFLPGDLEVDPRFTMLAEWKDWNAIRDLHEKNAIIRSILSWIDTKGYHFVQSGWDVWKRKNVGYPLRRLGFLEDKFPLNMSRNMLGLFSALDQVGKTLQDFLKDRNDQAILRSGGVLPSEEWMMKVLENYRQCELVRPVKEFHARFNSEK